MEEISSYWLEPPEDYKHHQECPTTVNDFNTCCCAALEARDKAIEAEERLDSER